MIDAHHPLYSDIEKLFNVFDIFFQCSKITIPNIPELITSHIIGVEWIKQNSYKNMDLNTNQLSNCHSLTFRHNNRDLIWTAKEKIDESINHNHNQFYMGKKKTFNIGINRFQAHEKIKFIYNQQDTEISKNAQSSFYELNQHVNIQEFQEFLKFWHSKIDYKLNLALSTEKFFAGFEPVANRIIWEQPRDYFILCLYAYRHQLSFHQIYVHCISSKMFEIESIEQFKHMIESQAYEIFEKFNLDNYKLGEIKEQWHNNNNAFLDKIQLNYDLNESLKKHNVLNRQSLTHRVEKI